MTLILNGTDNNVSIPAIQGGTGGTSTGIFYPAANSVAIVTSGANAVTVDSTQAVTFANNVTITGTSSHTGNATFSANVSAGAFIPTGNTAPVRGMYVSTTNNLSFSTNTTEILRFNSAGQALFLGTTNSEGGSAAFFIDSNLYNGVCYYNTRAQGGTYARFITVSTRTGSITTTDQTTTLYNTSSDYRLKTDIKPMVGAMERLLQVKPVNYTWIATGNPANGFIAHELQEVFPEAVSGVKDAVDENGEIDPQGVDASKLVPALVSAIQELKAEIDALKAKLAV